MRELLPTLAAWNRDQRHVGIATVVETFRSAPLPPGSAMAVAFADNQPDEVIGGVSGGCVEAALVEALREVADTGIPRLECYGISDGDAFAVGLTCGGEIQLWLEPLADWQELSELTTSVDAGEPIAVVTRLTVGASQRIIVTLDQVQGSLGDIRLDYSVLADARRMLSQGLTGIRHYGPTGERRGDETAVFVHSFASKPRLIVFGATDFAAATAKQGAILGYRVTVCDARPVFATSARFPDADDVIVAWPHDYLAAEAHAGRLDERTVICVLTHDPKFDEPVLEVALRAGVGYVGAMGSRRVHDDRIRQLRTRGVTDAELACLSSPIGLDIGARTPEETAVSIFAEIIATRWGGTGQRLRDSNGAIHKVLT